MFFFSQPSRQLTTQSQHLTSAYEAFKARRADFCENVASVRTLVLNALQVHRNATHAMEPVSYGLATQIIFDNQHICSPEKILALVRNAIARGEVISSSSQVATGAAASVGAAIDQAALQRLGSILNPPGAITMDQAGAFYWLLRDFSTIEQRKSVIAKKLEGLPSGSVPLDSDGNYKSPWSLEAAVRQELATLSPATIASIKVEIDKQRTAKISGGNESS